MTRYGKLREATAIYGAARNIQARSACEAIRRAVIRGSVRTRGPNGHYPHYHLEDVLMLACGYQRRPRNVPRE